MKPHACHISLIAALLAAPAAWAGSDIVKCVDRGGHVTLTDQPCEDGASAMRVATGNAADGAPPAASPALEHFRAPRELPRSAARSGPRSGPKRFPEAKRIKLSRDALTLKEARAQMLLLDEARGVPQPKLAGLN